MRLHAKSALLFLLFCPAGIPGALAQQKHVGSTGAYRAAREAAELPARPLTLDEGLAILNAALDSRHHAGFSSDCSHFVHGLYQRAGFPYEYASSSDLYAGIDEFRRVVNPQPGDLAVWPGHAGIVVNPVQHSFFSLLSFGPGVDSYDSPYWKRRGRPRFFRYVKAAPSGVLSNSLRTASLNPTILNPTSLGNAEPQEPAAEDVVSDAAEDSSNETQFSTRLATNKIVNPTISRVPVVHSIHPKPDQVSVAFLQSCAETEENLRGRDLFKSAQPVIVFDHFAVNEVHVAGNQGWVEVQIDEVFFLVDGKAESRRGLERQRWLLSRRDKTSWELTAPRGTIYVPQHIAVRILSHQLAQLTEERADTTARPQQKAELARVLDSLLRE
jgi:hypothetical protein